MTPRGAIYMEKIFQLYLVFVAVRCTWAIFHGVVQTYTNPLLRTRICVSVTEASNAKKKITERKQKSNIYYMAIRSDIHKSVLH